MLKRTVVILKMMFLVCAVSAQIQSARGEGAPILLSFGGDQWAWDATSPSAKQLTRSGVNRSAVLSPDGKWLAYKSTAQFVIDLAKKEGPFLTHGDFPADIWLLDIGTGAARRIAEQPRQHDHRVRQMYLRLERAMGGFSTAIAQPTLNRYNP